MKKLYLKDLKALVNVQEPAVTVYMKFTGARVKDYNSVESLASRALAEAREKFPEHAAAFAAVDISPLFAARSAADNWKCAVFFKSPSIEGFYPLREVCCETIIVGEGFHLKPLFSLIQFEQSFTVVWPKEETIRVYRGDAEGLTLLKEFSDVESEWEDTRNPQSRRALFAPVTRESSSPIETDRETLELQQRIGRFYRRTERIIRRDFLLGNEPVVLMGDAPLLDSYLATNRHRTHFLRVMSTSETGIESLEAAHLKSMEAVALRSQKPAMERALRYFDFRKVGNVVDSLAHIAGAAARGEVKSLIMRSGVDIWGKINRATGRVIVETAKIDAFSNDLLDAIGSLVLSKGGEVHVVNDSDMPTSSPVVAFLSAQPA